MQRFDPKKKVMQKTKNMQNRTNRETKKKYPCLLFLRIDADLIFNSFTPFHGIL